MAGAYLALPAVIPAIVYPPLWNPTWDFPGPLPPGFTPIDGMWLNADAEISVGSPTTSVQAVTMDVRNGTVDPTGSLQFTATIDGVPINLRLA